MDGQTARSVEAGRGVEVFLDEVRSVLKGRNFQPLPVRERMIPKPGTAKRRRLGIPTVRDRVVQASLKLVLEPIFEADFLPCSYGFRPKRRAHDALAEAHHFAKNSYEWMVEGDIEACFDSIDHAALMDRVRRRIGDRRVLDLVKAFLKAGILTEGGLSRETDSGTPQGGILSPLLANIALSVLDEFIAAGPGGPNSTQAERARRRRRKLPNYRLFRYADDFLIAVTGTRDDKVKTLCRQDTNLPLAAVLHRLNPVLRGWTAYFRHGVSSATFQYLSAFTWRQVFGWLRHKHRRTNWKTLRRRYCVGRWWPADGEVVLFKAAKVRTSRYLYRGTKIPSPWPSGATIDAVA
ncbi:reverse transcriptase domain-containing protein [Kitasatospora sp. MAA19]|uniref:reverse transcriptase domain-containing protein n=1 Tax=Kitasatospora sp. MAA19 TaxID=3035090 RepID=UPI002476BBA3|nr:reverse transcriptase domain-containing protein [Kitasatospora sp. MAA19]